MRKFLKVLGVGAVLSGVAYVAVRVVKQVRTVNAFKFDDFLDDDFDNYDGIFEKESSDDCMSEEEFNKGFSQGKGLESKESVDPFTEINRGTREEVIKFLVDSDPERFVAEELSKLSDGELTQVHIDFKLEK